MWLRTNRYLPWMLVVATATGLEMAALYIQYILDFNPCVLCIYQRTAVAGIALGGLIGVIAPRYRWFRFAGYLVIAISAIAGIRLSFQLVAVQAGQSMSCDFLADYPDWFKLDIWFPEVFQPTGYCDDAQWHFLDIGMPSWMAIIFSLYLAAIIYALVIEYLGGKSRRRLS